MQDSSIFPPSRIKVVPILFFVGESFTESFLAFYRALEAYSELQKFGWLHPLNGEESPGFMEKRCRLMAGRLNYNDWADGKCNRE